MIDLRKLNKATQTIVQNDIIINLTKNKVVRFYKSKAYKDYVLSFRISKTKNFIITKPMWKILRNYIPFFDKTLLE